MRLGMSLIVRDEADVIGFNIAYHASHGVEAFAIVDNGSEDGTFELLESLRQVYDIALFRDGDGFRKEERSMFLAGHLRDRLGATHLISNDADEFWVPQSGSLKGLMNAGLPVQRVARRNFIVRREELARPGYMFFDSTLLVVRPPAFQPPAPDPETPLTTSMPLRAVPGKVFCALDGLQKVFKGNHSVTHEGGEPQDTAAAIVLHYPVRSYEQFVKKVRNHGQNLGGVTGAESWHLRRWHSIHQAGRLREEFDRLLFDEPAVRSLIAAGTVGEERVIEQFFQAHVRRSEHGWAFAPAQADIAIRDRTL